MTSLLVRLRWAVLAAYLAVCAVVWIRGRGWESRFPACRIPASFACGCELRMGPISATETRSADTGRHREAVGRENVALTLGYVGMIPSSFPINGVYQWSRGPEEAILRLALKPNTRHRYRRDEGAFTRSFGNEASEVRFSFEPADIVSEVMSFGSSTPIEIAARGANLDENRDKFLNGSKGIGRIPLYATSRFPNRSITPP